MSSALSQQVLASLFTEARTASAFSDREVTDTDLEAIWDLTKMGPTAFNSQPLRITFLRSKQARERLLGHLAASNREKTQQAPITAILAFDTGWSDRFPEFNPAAAQRGIAAMFEGEENQQARHAAGYQSANIAAGYFIMAIRALGMAAGPMTGADFAGIDRDFYPAGDRKSFLLVNIGYGIEPEYPRNPRFTFSQVTEIL